MLGKKQFEPKLFYSIQLDQFIPQDHELRKILTLIDFSSVRREVKDKYSFTGQPSVDPEVILKMLFLGYYYGILSERQLAKRIQTDLSFRFFLGYDLDESPPTHSVLSKARSRYGLKVFQALFDQIVGQCIQAGLVEGKRAFLDATLIEANASQSSLMPRLNYLSPSEYTEKMLQEEGEEKQTPPQSFKEKESANERWVSSTDPEATLTKDSKGQTKLAYQGHYLIDRRSRIITAATASDTIDNAGCHAPSLLMHSRYRHHLFYESLCADSEYGTQDLYQFLFEEGFTPFIPPQGPKEKENPFSKKHFIYDPATDLYQCPQGQLLERKNFDSTKKRYRYSPVVSGICQECDSKSQCAKGKRDRSVRRLLFQEALDRARALSQTPLYRRQIYLRKTLIEPLFGEAKESHGLRKARYRGLLKVKMQVLWTATVLNIKRLLKKLQPRRKDPSFWMNLEIQRIQTFWSSILSCQRTLSGSFFLNPT